MIKIACLAMLAFMVVGCQTVPIPSSQRRTSLKQQKDAATVCYSQVVTEYMNKHGINNSDKQKITDIISRLPYIRTNNIPVLKIYVNDAPYQSYSEIVIWVPDIELYFKHNWLNQMILNKAYYYIAE